MNNSSYPGDPIMDGEPINCVTVSADAYTLFGFIAGAVTWQVTETEYIRGGHIHDGEFYYSCGKAVKVRNPANGEFIREYSFPDSTFVNTSWVGDVEGLRTLAVAYSGTGTNRIRLYNIEGTAFELQHVSPTSVSEVRGIYVEEGRLFIADTFHHLVKVVVIATGQIDAAVACWYPNDVRPMADGRVLVTAEHENRIFAWEPATGARELVLSAPVAPFNDITRTRAQIEAETPGTNALAPAFSPQFSPPKQTAAQEYHSGSISVYAPNAALQVGSGLLVADTDNHRVIMVRDGEVVTEIVNINAPVGVAIF